MSTLEPSLIPEAPRTDITYGPDGSIARLVTYYPEVRSGQIAIGVDLAAFAKKHPLGRVTNITHEVDESIGGNVVGIAEAGDLPLFATGNNELVISQHVGKVHPGGVAVAASLYPMDLAERVLGNSE